MVFVNLDEDRVRLEKLTKLLVHTFPGSVIYQYIDPVYAVVNTEDRAIDVMFINLNVSRENNWQLLALLRRKQPKMKIFVLSDDEQLRDTALECGDWEYMVRPVTGQKLQEIVPGRDI